MDKRNVKRNLKGAIWNLVHHLNGKAIYSEEGIGIQCLKRRDLLKRRTNLESYMRKLSLGWDISPPFYPSLLVFYFETKKFSNKNEIKRENLLFSHSFKISPPPLIFGTMLAQVCFESRLSRSSFLFFISHRPLKARAA